MLSPLANKLVLDIVTKCAATQDSKDSKGAQRKEAAQHTTLSVDAQNTSC